MFAFGVAEICFFTHFKKSVREKQSTGLAPRTEGEIRSLACMFFGGDIGESWFLWSNLSCLHTMCSVPMWRVDESYPHHTIPHHNNSHHTAAQRHSITTQHHTTTHHTKSYHTAAGHSRPRHTTPHHTTPHHTTPHHSTPQHTTQHHTTSHHTTPQDTTHSYNTPGASIFLIGLLLGFLLGFLVAPKCASMMFIFSQMSGLLQRLGRRFVS